MAEVLHPITFLWEFGGYHLFTKWEDNVVVKSDVNEERYAVMNAWMFHKQTHICNTRTELRRKIEHNKKARKLCQILNRKYQ